MTSMPPNPVLEPLKPLVGEWTIRVPTFEEAEAAVTCEWLEDGGFLRIHSASPPPFPTATQLVGRDDSSDVYTVLYYDSRGVSRVYQMTFDNGLWKMWRDAPGFDQRFSGTLSADGRTIQAAWEKSLDNETWEHDFDIIYTKVT
ncbi:hypothetical protein E1287_16445 [Actinomadura sp. KC06]|uniref:hypothetical protein n=1 Tax=Actinomadura sp. KC06 TaxID=2530369 RepID=UPI0010473F4D|nr:hypothetical protein [Actinomadura sp. KC06]TDD34482.1 hypothetical protein E1287_16445 [Actinomadura sp. KC06]